MSKLKKILKFVLIILLTIICIFSVIKSAFIIPIHNVFDEMYYSGLGEASDGMFLQWGMFVTGCSYQLKQFESSNLSFYDTYLEEQAEFEDFKQFSKRYKKSELNEGENLLERIFFDKKIIYYGFSLSGNHSVNEKFQPYTVWRCYYYVDKNIMYINGPTLYFSKGGELLSTTDKEQIEFFLQENGYDKTAEEYEHYFLYDKIIHDWTLGNLFRSRYTTWRIGRVKFVDGSPPEQTA